MVREFTAALENLHLQKQLLERLLDLRDPEAQARLLSDQAAELDETVVEALKKRADHELRADIHRTLEIANLLIAISEFTSRPTDRALGLLAEANARSIGLGEYERAIELYDQAAEIYRTEGRPNEHAGSQIGKIGALANLGRYQEALDAGQKAVSVLKEVENWLSIAKITSNLGIIHYRLGDDSQALDSFELAQRYYERDSGKHESEWLRAELNRSIVLRNLGRFEDSLEASRRAHQRLEELGQDIEAARARQNLAMTLFVQGKFNETLSHLDRVRSVFLADGRLRDVILVELFMSECLLQLRRFQDVLQKCEQVRTSFTELGTRFEVTLAILNEAAAHAGLRQFPKALKALNEARANFEADGNRTWVAYADVERAAILLELQQAGEALATIDSSLDLLIEQPIKRAEAMLIGARACLALTQFEQTQVRAEEALKIAQQKDIPSLIHPCLHLLGQLHAQNGQPELALDCYERAMEALERLRGRLMIEFRAGFLEDKQAVYEDAVDLCLDLERPEQSLDLAERAKSRALLELLANRLFLGLQARAPEDESLVAELILLKKERDRLYRRWASNQPEDIRERGWDSDDPLQHEAHLKTLDIEGRITELWHRLLIRNADYARDAGMWQVRTEPIQPYLDENTSLLEYFIAKGKLIVFLVQSQQIRAWRLPVELGVLRRLTQLFWLNLRSTARASQESLPGLASNARGLLSELYQVLLAPVISELSSTQRLIIVPHGNLHYLPFHAFYDGDHHLLQHFEISYLPAGSFLRYCRETQPQADACLVMGHSQAQALPHAVAEADQIAALLNCQAHTETAANLAILHQEAPRARILHLATHAEFRPDNPLFSGLALDDGWLTTFDIFNLKLDASLVTLSACQTGRNVIAGGDELLGLVRAFLQAGVASLALSLWAVEDRSTSTLMLKFYQALKDGRTKAGALRSAQLSLLQGSEDEPSFESFWSHPYYWAPFTLIGDPGTL